MSKWTGLALAALLACGLVAVPAFAESRPPTARPGVLHVYDEGKFFSSEGVDKAKAALSGARFDHGLSVTVDTYNEVPADKKAAAEAAKGDKAKWRNFMETWTKERAQGDKAKGIYIVIVQKPIGGIGVIADRETRERGFSDQDEEEVRKKFAERFSGLKDADEAKKREGHDAGLKDAVEFIVSDLKDTHVAVATSSSGSTKADQDKPGRSVGGWICIGLCVLLGVWLVIGLIRAFSGGGGGGYGGGGGGGFGSSLLGGLFGAMAGMWLYNSMFGGGMMGGSDAHAADGSTGAEGGDTGAGDYGGESGAGGDYDTGGGDGGGGDFSGGGDFGGGGGDFGGDF
jgi:hypothetical protein